MLCVFDSKRTSPGGDELAGRHRQNAGRPDVQGAVT